MVVCFSRSMKGSGSSPEQFAELAQEFGCRVQADRRLQVGTIELLAEQPAELAIQADVDVGLRQLRNVGDMGTERERQVDLGTDAFDEATDLGQVGRHVERAVDWPDDIDAGLVALLARLAGGHLLRPELGPQPVDRAVRRLPLVFVDGAREEALDVGAFRRDAAADHLGDGTSDDDRWERGVKHFVGALHRAFGAGLAQLFLAETGDDDRQLVRRQTIGVVQHGRNGQVLAADRTVDDDLQALDGP